MRLLLIGLDGLDPVIARKDKNFSKLQIRSIKSVESVNTQEAWSTIYTGLDPQEHGIHPRRRDLKEPWDQAPRYLTFFEVLKKNGFKVGLISMPMTYSSFIPDFGEFAVAGFPLPLPEHRKESSMYFPQEIKSMAKSYYPYLWHDEPRKMKSEVNCRTLLNSIEKELKKVDLAKDIIASLGLELDMLSIGFQFGDICSHCRAVMPVEETYRHLYTAMQRSMLTFQADNIMVVSDHGLALKNWEGKPIFDKYSFLPNIMEKIFRLPMKSHRRDAGFIIRGGYEPHTAAHIKDIYDIIMDIFGVDKNKVPRTDRQKFSPEEEQSIRSRLRDLGYLG